MKESVNVIKTIKVKKEMRFRELMEYIIQNDVIGDFKCIDGKHGFSVDIDGIFCFETYHYDDGETYEVEVEEEITEDTKFDKLVEIYDNSDTITHHFTSIRNIKDITTEKIYALIGGELVKIWQRGEENV